MKDAVNAYLEKRAETGKSSNFGDDRCSEDKMWADADLRGRLGCNRANVVIAAIDEIRSRR